MTPKESEEDPEIIDTLNRAEFTVYQRAVEASAFSAILNEAEIPSTALMDLPPSVRGEILSKAQRKSREHPDIRLARRARTIAELARIISERRVKAGIRRTLWTQAVRLEHLARTRREQLERRKKR